MNKEEQKRQQERRRCEQFAHAATLRLNMAVRGQHPEAALRAARDLAQVIDEQLLLAGVKTEDVIYGPQTEDGADIYDCPDCGQVVNHV